MAIEMTAHADVQAGAGAPPGLLGQLQGDRVERDDIVRCDGALLDVTEDLVEIDVPHGAQTPGLDRAPQSTFAAPRHSVSHT
jgi:hypothetical protein